jgi:hypothetical protein
MRCSGLEASLATAQGKEHAARAAQLGAEALCEAKERERASFAAIHNDLDAELLGVRKAKGKIDVMYQKLVTAGAYTRPLLSLT